MELAALSKPRGASLSATVNVAACEPNLTVRFHNKASVMSECRFMHSVWRLDGRLTRFLGFIFRRSRSAVRTRDTSILQQQM